MAWLRPFLMGLALTPLAGLTAYVVTLFMLIPDLPELREEPTKFLMLFHPVPLAFGLFIGSGIAFPVTAILLPVLYRFRVGRMGFVLGGGLGGAAVCAALNRENGLILIGAAAGLVAGLVYGRWASRRRSREARAAEA